MQALGFANTAATVVTAINVAKEVIAIKWADGNDSNDLPKELSDNKTSILILSLPDVFKNSNYRLSAKFISSWLYGTDLNKDNSLPAHKRYRVFDRSEITNPKTVNSVFEEARASALTLVGQDGATGFTAPRWRKMREKLKEIDRINARQGNKEWNYQDKPFESFSVNPEIYFGRQVVTHGDYILNGEFISDSMGALARFNINKYLRFSASKNKKGEIYVKPRHIGLRVEDRYNFIDSEWHDMDIIAGLLLNLKSSQPLGYFKNSSDGATYSLSNRDFEEFKRNFAPKYNLLMANKKPKLVCQNFEVYSVIESYAFKNAKSYKISLSK